MAITFEEKSDTVRNAAIIAGMAALLLAAGFFAWKLIHETPAVDFTATKNEFKINKEVLNDSRFAALELFPEIPPATAATARENPFAEGSEPGAVAPAAFAAESSQTENGEQAE